MRYQGRVSEWTDERGFGFILPNGGGRKVFFHHTSFSYRTRRPVVGDFITYELGTDENGRQRANAARFVDDHKSGQHQQQSIGVGSVFAGVLIAAFLGYVAYVRMSHPNSTVSASMYKIFIAREALRQNSQFQCEAAKSSCSQMSSCAEAFFHQERCGISNMDGDRDGIPCEQQWCN